jgi:lysophospholipid acyltransferase (LPLAT)-like uncharacterized protein
VERKRDKGRRIWFRLALFWLPILISVYFRLVDLTSRKIYLNREHEDRVWKRRSFAAVTFHGAMLYPLYYARKYHALIMVSRSWDGDLIARCLHRWGYDTTRGSSSRGGKEALSEMIEILKRKDWNSALAVDAPRGPAREAKIGAVVLARETGRPVVPLVSWATRKIQFGSWDRMILPLPFSTIVLSFGKPIEVPKGLEREDYEQIRREIEDELNRALDQAIDRVKALKERKKT